MVLSLDRLEFWTKWASAAAGVNPSSAMCCPGPMAEIRWELNTVLCTSLLPYPHCNIVLLPQNVMPPTALLQPTVLFRKDMRKISLFNALIVGTHFLAGFILLVIVYGMLIRLIRKMRKSIRGRSVKEWLLPQGTRPLCGPRVHNLKRHILT